MLFETNIYLLVVTMIVSVLHTIFSTLAIKNDYQYWKNLSSHEGISVRTLYSNLFVEVVVTLYLLDNETSFLILITQLFDIGLMVWKVMKTSKFKRSSKFPFVQVEHNQSYQQSTCVHDQ